MRSRVANRVRLQVKLNTELNTELKSIRPTVPLGIQVLHLKNRQTNPQISNSQKHRIQIAGPSKGHLIKLNADGQLDSESKISTQKAVFNVSLPFIAFVCII